MVSFGEHSRSPPLYIPKSSRVRQILIRLSYYRRLHYLFHLDLAMNVVDAAQDPDCSVKEKAEEAEAYIKVILFLYCAFVVNV